MLRSLGEEQFLELIEYEKYHPQDDGWEQTALLTFALWSQLEVIIAILTGDKPKAMKPEAFLPQTDYYKKRADGGKDSAAAGRDRSRYEAAEEITSRFEARISRIRAEREERLRGYRRDVRNIGSDSGHSSDNGRGG